MKTLAMLFLKELANGYQAQNGLSHPWPKPAKALTLEDLCEAFESRLAEIESQVGKLQQVLDAAGAPAHREDRGQTLPSRQRREIPWSNQSSSSAHGALNFVTQTVDHYEMALYATLRKWAEHLGNREAIALLEESLADEKNGNQRFWSELGCAGCDEAA